MEVVGVWPGLGVEGAARVDVTPSGRLRELIGVTLER